MATSQASDRGPKPVMTSLNLRRARFSSPFPSGKRMGTRAAGREVFIPLEAPRDDYVDH